MIVRLHKSVSRSRFNQAPKTWKHCVADGQSTVTICCANGHVFSAPAHDIWPSGVVNPSLVCPQDGCDWHVQATLLDWVNRNG